jgi:hypothetical protein
MKYKIIKKSSKTLKVTHPGQFPDSENICLKKLQLKEVNGMK